MTLFYEEPFGKLYQGHVLDILKQLPDGSVDICITSPPYWGLRDYKTEPQIWADGWKGELGNEPIPQMYIGHLLMVFNEIYRILKKTGTCWVNIDDSYAGSGKGIGSDRTKGKESFTDIDINKTKWNNVQIPHKSLCNIPERLCLALCDEGGWIKRNNIIWQKNNIMPDPVKDRFTNDSEFLYFFVKSNRYYFKQQFDEYVVPMNRWGGNNLVANGVSMWDDGTGQNSYRDRDMRPNKEGRNKRTTWSINTEPSTLPHYAAYPEKLCETPILAGCPQYICSKCGKAREKIYERKVQKYNSSKSYTANTINNHNGEGKSTLYTDNGNVQLIDRGYSDCGCGAEFYPGIVLDPFMGTGTTAAVAKRLGCKFMGIELKENYCRLAVDKIQGVTIPMNLENGIEVKNNKQDQGVLL